ncbi:probable disease resistance protein At4g19060 [Cucurbita maxima]|uniref:Probable disease resistance protein At4g19060 n=1 Tax=Cucurbita maxima TaxID=3661 RepID=A0A6J1K9W9_CUCMA|nr:probable disease resistance protein At4g19060 [Cucurbita maxima]
MNATPPDSEIHPTQPETKISRWVAETVDESTIHGVENELLVLRKMLEKPEVDGGGNGFRAIGVTGVRGIGKSTVCRAFLQNPEVKSKFLPRIWVSMSRIFSEDRDTKIAVLKRILISLGVGIDTNIPGEQTVRRLLYALRLQLRGKRYLVVLDDVQESETEEEQNGFWDLNCSQKTGENFRDGFPRGEGGAIIVTSRSEKAAKGMVGEGNLRRLVPQKDPESLWKIFWQEVAKDGDSSLHRHRHHSNLKETKVEVMKKCGGLPLAAKMMGQIKFIQQHSNNPDTP